MLERIDHWVVVMFENRSFDNLLGHLPHLDAADGIRGRTIDLAYPGGSVRVAPTNDLCAPIPDPGESYGNTNVQLWGAFNPPANAGRGGFRAYPRMFHPPYNVPDDPAAAPTMDGFALDFYWNFTCLRDRRPTDDEMASAGAVFTPDTAPVINTLAAEYAVFTRWFSEVPSLTLPNRSFYHCGTSHGRVDNEFIVNFGWDFRVPNLFDRCTAAGLAWRAYFAASQRVPYAAVNLAGLHHREMWRNHMAERSRFFADAAAGTLPAYSWLEPNLFFGEVNDYHPPGDIRLSEHFLASVYNAVRTSPQWRSTALVVLFDEHGGCYDHVVPPAAPPPDDSPCEEGFGFDRFGLRVPAIVISPYTARGTVIRDTFHHTAVLRTLRERFNLGPALTARDAAAPTLDVAFNLADARDDALAPIPLPSLDDIDRVTGTKPGDRPDAHEVATLLRQRRREFVSELGLSTLRNAARQCGDDPDSVPTTASAARAWLAERFDLHLEAQQAAAPASR